MSLMMSQLSRVCKHGQQVTVVGQIFHSAAPQSCSTLWSESDAWVVSVLRQLLPRLVFLQIQKESLLQSTVSVWHVHISVEKRLRSWSWHFKFVTYMTQYIFFCSFSAVLCCFFIESKKQRRKQKVIFKIKIKALTVVEVICWSSCSKSANLSWQTAKHQLCLKKLQEIHTIITVWIPTVPAANNLYVFSGSGHHIRITSSFPENNCWQQFSFYPVEFPSYD